MKFALIPFTPLSAEAQAQTFGDIVAGFIQMGQGENFELFTKTAELLTEFCDQQNPFKEFPALDVLTVALYKFALGIPMPHKHLYDEICSTPRFIQLMEEVLKLNEDTNPQTRAQMLAWRTFLEGAVSRLRGPLFPGARSLEITSTSNGKTYHVEIDSFAATTVDELRTIVEEQRYGITTDAMALHYFTDRIPYGKWNAQWNDFCANAYLEPDVQKVLTAELVRLVSNAFGARFEPAS
jgi:hypothetical protein